jgi:hypothetical protein
MRLNNHPHLLSHTRVNSWALDLEDIPDIVPRTVRCLRVSNTDSPTFCRFHRLQLPLVLAQHNERNALRGKVVVYRLYSYKDAFPEHADQLLKTVQAARRLGNHCFQATVRPGLGP